MKKIVIKNCATCPSREHRGAYGRIIYIPRCGKTSKNLPYNIVVQHGILYAEATEIIPKWCPLEDN